MQALAVSAVKKTEVSAGVDVFATVANKGETREAWFWWTGEKAVAEANSAMAAMAVEKRMFVIVDLGCCCVKTLFQNRVDKNICKSVGEGDRG